MDWNQLSINPKTLLGYYSSAPSLNGVTLFTLSLSRDGPCAELVIEPRVFLEQPSTRWPAGSNTCQITLRAIGLTKISVDAWGTGVHGDLQIEPNGEGLMLTFRGDASFQVWFHHLQVVHVVGYPHVIHDGRPLQFVTRHRYRKQCASSTRPRFCRWRVQLSYQ